MFKLLFSKIYIAVVLIFTAVVIGVIGYAYLENMSVLDALYMTIITLSTVGFGEVKELSRKGEIFTIILIVTNIGIFTYALTSISSYLLNGEFRERLNKLRLNNTIEKLKNHVIVCGYGRNGQQVCSELKSYNIPFVVIENNEKLLDKLNDAQILHIDGDATDDLNLVLAGIQHAKSLVSALPTDADNVFVVLTAKRMNPNLKIISRATVVTSEQKLKSAGADNVVMPEKIGGSHMASLIIKPDILEFIDIVTGRGAESTSVEEIGFENLKSQYKNKTIEELNFRKNSGANIIGFKKPSGEYIINPAPEMIIEPGSKLIVLATPRQLQSVKSIFLSSPEFT